MRRKNESRENRLEKGKGSGNGGREEEMQKLKGQEDTIMWEGKNPKVLTKNMEGEKPKESVGRGRKTGAKGGGRPRKWKLEMEATKR